MDTNVQVTSGVDYVRPDRLIEGADYVWLEPHPCKNYAVQETVRFVGYAPSPATVIVLDNKEHRLYIPRVRLFLNNHDQLPTPIVDQDVLALIKRD